MNAHATNRYCERLLSMYTATTDHHVRVTIDTEWRAAWADLLRQYNERLQERLWRNDYNGQSTPACPACDSGKVLRRHYHGSMLAPECDFWECESCGYDWGHE